jgi:hypothetical protein
MIERPVDFLMPRDAELARNEPPLISNFAVQRASGADLAMRFYQMVAIAGPMPGGGVNRIEIAVCSVPALLAMKGHAMSGRYKQKDAYDIYYCIRNYPGGVDALAAACGPLLAHISGQQGFSSLNEKFNTLDGYGPTCVRRFVEDSQVLGERTAEQWQRDAFGQVDALLRKLSLRD